VERTGRRGKRIKNIIDTFVNDEGALVVILIGAIFLLFFFVCFHEFVVEIRKFFCLRKTMTEKGGNEGRGKKWKTERDPASGVIRER